MIKARDGSADRVRIKRAGEEMAAHHMFLNSMHTSMVIIGHPCCFTG
jgi:hypothetical protein